MSVAFRQTAIYARPSKTSPVTSSFGTTSYFKPRPISSLTRFLRPTTNSATSRFYLRNYSATTSSGTPKQTSTIMAKKTKREAPEYPELSHPSTKRAKQIDQNTPYDQLLELLEKQKQDHEPSTIVHWFRSQDLRIHDNRALHDASTTAEEAGKPLICCYINCPAEHLWHGTSPARLDFEFCNLESMRQELKKLDIPLVILEASDRDSIVPTMVKFVKEQKASHVFANYEYEIDELRRDIKFLKAAKDDFQVTIRHDQTVMEPGAVTTGTGTPMKVFTPYHGAWLATVKSDPSLLDTVSAPTKNSAAAKKQIAKLFDSTPIPTPPKEKQFPSTTDRDRIRKLWPAGHSAAVSRLNHFLTHNLSKYAETRSNPGKDTTSRLSPYFSAGVLSMRETCTAVMKKNSNSSNFSESSAKPGIYSWVRELVFRELYRQTLLTTPHTAMNLPGNLKFTLVQWEDNKDHWKAWKSGHTGMPLVDAGMRQLAAECWMHNRARMNVSSYLYTNLLLDHRRGERYFAETLVDWDLSNNTQGWEPSYTVFNPVSQAERNDPDGEYIRRWVPELRGVEGKAVFDPYGRMAKGEWEKLGYPKPVVDWKETKARAMERFKRDMSGVEP